MKRFDIITESDARVLPRGETVVLARGGHITPLAQDTLRERRITVVREGRASDDEASLAPRGRHPQGGDRQRPHRRRRCAGRWSRFSAAAASPCRISAPTAPTRSTIRMSPRRSPMPSRAATPTPASSSTAAGIGSAIAANKSARRPRRDGDRTRPSPATRASTTAPTSSRSARRSIGADEARAIVDDVADDADEGAALYSAAGEDTRSGAATLKGWAARRG